MSVPGLRPPIVAEVTADGDPLQVRVRVVGEVDQLNVPELVEAAEPWLRDGVAEVVVDLLDVVFIDSAGIGSLIRLWKTGRDRGVPLRLEVRHEAVVALVEVTGVARFIDVAVVPTD